MAEFDREDYKKQLADLPRRVRVLLAYRNALRGLPLLTAQSSFEYYSVGAAAGGCHGIGKN